MTIDQQGLGLFFGKKEGIRVGYRPFLVGQPGSGWFFYGKVFGMGIPMGGI